MWIMVFVVVFVFFFKQKTAYEMRISDWSSDVCSSDLSFGLFGDASPWMLIALTLAIVIGFVIWLKRAENRLTAVALGLIIGGALGNALDRLRHGAVTDFLDFYVAAYHWPAFNFADTGIVSGVGLLLLESGWPRDEGKVRKADSTSIR